MKTPKITAGQIWYQAETGDHFLVAGADRTHVVVCQVAVRRDGHPVAHPRGRKADRILARDFDGQLFEYVTTATAAPKAGASDGR
ncbi:hypothetical protein AB0F20_05500 [Streptomyces goshikiensis]|uniref:hypothetical protein n=1 Tax=Streptomyces goshikiensis TaxID=1942 RepID=UPI0033CDA3F8